MECPMDEVGKGYIPWVGKFKRKRAGGISR